MPNRSPKVSLLMTVYNREQFLAEAIDSALEQTYKDFELLIWDDGSTDSSVEIAKQYAQKDDRIFFFPSPHQGRNAALRAVHKKARGKYVGWLDSDDRLTPATLAATVSMLDTQIDLGMVYTDYQVIGQEGENQGLGSRCQIPFSKERLLVDFMTFHFRLFRQSCFEQVGGVNPAFEVAIDYDLCLRLSEVTEIYHLRVPLYQYRVHSQSLSVQQRKMQIDASLRAIELALVRRCLDKNYRLEVDGNDKFNLKKIYR
jgi:glycosyltransferase involved in cell wall biosynthesis